jgi:hypothetical protein
MTKFTSKDTDTIQEAAKIYGQVEGGLRDADQDYYDAVQFLALLDEDRENWHDNCCYIDKWGGEIYVEDVIEMAAAGQI